MCKCLYRMKIAFRFRQKKKNLCKILLLKWRTKNIGDIIDFNSTYFCDGDNIINIDCMHTSWYEENQITTMFYYKTFMYWCLNLCRYFVCVGLLLYIPIPTLVIWYRISDTIRSRIVWWYDLLRVRNLSIWH